MTDPYLLADRAIKLLNRKATARFEKAKQDCAKKKFDELNVIKIGKQLYKDLDADARSVLLELAQKVYSRETSTGTKPNKKWLEGVLEAYDPVALYIYLNEVDRKREYTVESVNASTAKTKEFQRALRYWSRMIHHEADRVTDEATLKAYRDAGVKKVKWVTQADEKVCEECSPKNGKVYDIEKVPSKPHLNCRCWLEAVK